MEPLGRRFGGFDGQGLQGVREEQSAGELSLLGALADAAVPEVGTAD
jgi:hypothetical protein